MISRVAESCFWLSRYLERADSSARLMQANRDFVLDVEVEERWHPVIVVFGERERFNERFKEDASAANDDEIVQDYLVWDEESPVSIKSSMRWARENARTIREVISSEMWNAINAFWHWLKSPDARKLYSEDRSQFYAEVIEFVATFQGLAYSTMMHEQPFDFMRLGTHLERAMQTGRTLDVNHHMLGTSEPGAVETAAEAAQWLTLLRGCSATEPFFKRSKASPSGAKVADFLILEPRFPRSVLHCLQQSWYFMQRIRRTVPEDFGDRSARKLEELLTHLESRNMDAIQEAGVHDELTYLIDTSTVVCNAIHADYFNPSLDSLPPSAA